VDLKSLNLDVILKRPLRQRLAILAAINAAVAGLIFYFLISPTLAEITDQKAKLAEVTAKLEESRTIASDIKKFQDEKADLEKRLEVALSQLPNEKEIPDLIDSISDAVKDVGLKTFIFKPQSERAKGFYAEVPVNMTVQGGYESLYEFCDRVSKLPRIVNIENITIKTTSQKGLTPILDADFQVVTFRFIPTPAEAPPAK
jgi:type IV pilus assembly protein PilO